MNRNFDSTEQAVAHYAALGYVEVSAWMPDTVKMQRGPGAGFVLICKMGARVVAVEVPS